MTDGDILKRGILAQYANAYRQICEGVATPTQQARAVARGLRGLLHSYGPGPVRMLDRIAGHIEHALQGQLSTKALKDLDRLIGEERRMASGKTAGLDAVADASRGLMQSLYQGEQHDDIQVELAERYVDRVREVTFDS